MKPFYIAQVLIKQVKIDPYSANFIVNLLIKGERVNWKIKFSNILNDMIHFPQIKPMHNLDKLQCMWQ